MWRPDVPTFEGYPFAAALAMLFAVAMLRGQATYWVARAITEQALRRSQPLDGWRGRAYRWLASEPTSGGRSVLARWGTGAVVICYLTVGIQTVVLATAGAVRMPWRFFTAAQMIGALLWALIYSTVGLAVWWAAWTTFVTGSPWAAVLLAVVAAAAVMVGRRRRAVTPLELDRRPEPQLSVDS